MKARPSKAKIISLGDARARLRERSRLTPKSRGIAPPNVWKCGECEEVTEELLQFHPVFRPMAE
jgi:hypothetical protein